MTTILYKFKPNQLDRFMQLQNISFLSDND